MFSMETRMLTFFDFAKIYKNLGGISNLMCLKQQLQVKVIGFRTLRASQKIDQVLISNNFINCNTVKNP